MLCIMTGYSVSTTGRTRRRMDSTNPLNDVRPASAPPATSRSTGAVVPLSITTASAEETQALGEALGRLLQPGDLILLRGPIGAGKTTFTQGLARGLGLNARVTSPSFTLANVYEPEKGGFPLFHLDLWRIRSPLEALGIGLDEYLDGAGATVIEWPEVAEVVLPVEYLAIRFALAGDTRRRLALEPVGERPRQILARLQANWVRQPASGGGTRASGD